jgi:nucleoside-diphosphate-sugar epimerase
MTNKRIILAGGTGDLGQRIAKALLLKGAEVRILTRMSGSSDKLGSLIKSGAKAVRVDYRNSTDLSKACDGGTCVISALSGLRGVIVETQKQLLDAAVKAKISRFIPSDYSIDFTKLPTGTNRNLDLRREFHSYLEKAPISATSILNGAFMDMLTGQAPFILFKLNRVLYYGNADQLLDFTTKDDAANFAAEAALDPRTPRYLRIAGDQISARQLAEVVGRIKGRKYRLLHGGGLGMLNVMIKMAKAFSPETDDIYPAWQGMQYMHNMYSGVPKLEPIDNNRYPHLKWTRVKDFLSEPPHDVRRGVN